MTKPLFNKKQTKILERSLNYDNTVQNLHSKDFGHTYLADEVQHIRKKLCILLDVSHETVKREVFYCRAIENSKRKIYTIGTEWRRKVEALLTPAQDEA